MYTRAVTAPVAAGTTTEQGSGMDIVAVLLALVVFGLMFGLIRALERI
jgi:hypothetical protein